MLIQRSGMNTGVSTWRRAGPWTHYHGTVLDGGSLLLRMDDLGGRVFEFCYCGDPVIVQGVLAAPPGLGDLQYLLLDMDANRWLGYGFDGLLLMNLSPLPLAFSLLIREVFP